MKYSLFALLILMMVSTSFGKKNNPKCIYEWKYPCFEGENETEIKAETCPLYDAKKTKDGKVFVTMPREFCPNACATLAIISNKTGSGGPLLRPYPNWEWHKLCEGNCICERIVSASRVVIENDYLFVLDNGKIGSKQISNPKIWIFNLINDTLVKTIEIPIEMSYNATKSGLLVEMAVYFPNEICLDNVIIFIADTYGSGLLVYDVSRKHMCRIESKYMKSTDPIFTIAGTKFFYSGSMYSLGFINKKYLMYHVVSGKAVYLIKIEDVIKCPNETVANEQTKVIMKLPHQSGYVAAKDDKIYYTDTTAMTLNAAQIFTKYNKISVETKELTQNSTTLQGVTAISVGKYKLMYLMDRYQVYATKKVNKYEINNRICEL